MQMRKFRIFLASVMLAAALAWLLLGQAAPGPARIAEFSQIIPSALLSCLGTTVFWLVASLLFGRVYCATVCPVGTLQDIAVYLRRKTERGKKFRYKKSNRLRFAVLAAYIVSLSVGILMVGYVIEPWNMMRNAASIVRPEDVATTWGSLSSRFSALALTAGMVSGLIAIAGIFVWSWISGRAFCTDICPLGTAMGCVHSQTLMHIAIDPDRCVSCMKCEDVCSCRCIKVEARFVDNSRCVRCFDCISVCPNAAIRFQLNKDRMRQTPLLNPSN